MAILLAIQFSNSQCSVLGTNLRSGDLDLGEALFGGQEDPTGQEAAEISASMARAEAAAVNSPRRALAMDGDGIVFG